MYKIKMSRLFFICTLTLVSILNSISVKADMGIPPATNLKYINDYAGIMDSSTAEYVVSVGRELESKTGAQAVVVILNSLEGNDIESYAFELFRNWGIGGAKEDNGLLMLIALQDRRWKVEVGKGLEGAITDIYSARVMDEFAAPSFRAGDYGLGIRNAYSVYADSIAKEYNITLEKNINSIPRELPSNRPATSGSPLGLFILLGLFLIDLIFNRGRISAFLLKLLFWSSIFKGPRGGPRGGYRGGGGNGGFGGFGGGKSGGGGSSGSW